MRMKSQLEYRILSRTEIDKLSQIDRTETVDNVYYMRDGNLVLEKEHWDVSEWSLSQQQQLITDLRQIYDKGATFFGAIDGDTLAGMSVLDHNPINSGVDRLNLAGLWVSNKYRRQAVGKKLTSLAIQEAHTREARILYVSATPSENTIRFYTSLGFQLADPVDPVLFKEEPEDIHLELILEK